MSWLAPNLLPARCELRRVLLSIRSYNRLKILAADKPLSVSNSILQKGRFVGLVAVVFSSSPCCSSEQHHAMRCGNAGECLHRPLQISRLDCCEASEASPSVLRGKVLQNTKEQIESLPCIRRVQEKKGS